LGWHGQRAVVTYLRCPGCDKEECYVEDDREQGVLPYWKREKISWCGCKGEKEQSGTQARDLRSITREEIVAQPREAEAQ